MKLWYPKTAAKAMEEQGISAESIEAQQAPKKNVHEKPAAKSNAQTFPFPAHKPQGSGHNQKQIGRNGCQGQGLNYGTLKDKTNHNQ